MRRLHTGNPFLSLANTLMALTLYFAGGVLSPLTGVFSAPTPDAPAPGLVAPAETPANPGASPVDDDTPKFSRQLSEKAQRDIEDEFDNRKIDPVLAGALAWYTPGLGHLYSRRPLPGVTFFLAENLVLLSAFLSIADINLGTDADTGIGISVQIKRNEFGEIPASNRRFAIGLLAVAVGVHLWNIVDAVENAKSYNLDLFRNIEMQYITQAVAGDHRRARAEERHYLGFSSKF